MRIERIRLEDVRGVEACEVSFDADGVTVVEAPNESGKSTLLDAVDVLLRFKDSSTAQEVRDLQPVGRDVGSLVEVDLRCGRVRLTCRKRYRRQRETVLEIHAPTREQLTGDEAHERLREILDDEVDLALYRALRLRQGRDLEAIELGASEALAARLDASAGGAGSTEGDALLERAREAYEEHFTPTGRPRKDLTQLDEAVADLDRRRVGLEERQRALHTDVEELTRLEGELPGLERRLETELDPALAEQEQRLEALRSARQRLDTRDAEHESAAARLAAAGRDRDERAALADRAARLAGEVATLEQQLEPVARRQEELAAELAELEGRRDEAEAAAREAERERAGRELEADLVAAAAERDRLAARHQRVADLVEEADAARRGLAGLVVDDAALVRVRDAVQDLRIAEAALQAGAPEVLLRARTVTKVSVDDEYVALDDGEERRWTVGERLSLSLPELLDVEVRAGTSATELHRAVEDARARLADACGAVGVADAEEAESAAARRRETVEALRRAEAALERELDGTTADALATELHDHEQRVATLLAQAPVGAPTIDPAQAREQLGTARAEAQRAALAAEDARAARDEAAATVAEQREAATRQRVALEQGAEDLARVRAQLDQARTDVTDEDLRERVVAAERVEAEAAEALATARAELEGLDPDTVELEASAVRAEHEHTRTRVRELRERRAGLAARLETVGAEGLGEALAETSARRERAEADRRRRWARARAAEALYTTLRECREETYHAYREPLRERIVAQARLLYGRDDLDVELDDELAIVTRTLDGVTLRWDQLSAGAREQLAVVSALCAARLAGEDGVPFVLDDALGYTDPLRLERLCALLGRASGAQVIVLTCVAERFRHVEGARTVRLLPNSRTTPITD